MPLDFTDLIPDRQAQGLSFDDLIPDQKQQGTALPDLIPDKPRQALSFDDLVPVRGAAIGQPFTNIANAAIAGAKEGYGSGAPSPEVQAANALATKDLGALAPVVHGINWMSDAGGRPLNALYRGAQGGIVQLATELGMPQLGRDLASVPESLAGSPEALRTPEPVEPPLSLGPRARVEPRAGGLPGSGALVPAPGSGPLPGGAAAELDAMMAEFKRQHGYDPRTEEAPKPAAAPEPPPAARAPQAAPAPAPASALPQLVRDETPVAAAPEPKPAAAQPAPATELPPLVRDEPPAVPAGDHGPSGELPPLVRDEPQSLGAPATDTDRLAAQHGIDPAGLTHDQVHDQLADRASPEAHAAEHARIADEHAEAYEDAEKAAKDWIAYHGTPHEFDQFDIGKIGTGEGAQVFGHGLYFAENEDIGDQYRHAVTMQHAATPDRIEAEQALADAIRASNAKFSDLQGQGVRVSSPEMDAALEPFRKAIEDAREKAGERPVGHLYTVRIKANPVDMLDWDKPLSEQSPHVRNALDKAGIAYADENPAMLGSSIYNNASQTFEPRQGRSPAQVSADRLRAAGIKGIRYKDAGSRDDQAFEAAKANLEAARTRGNPQGIAHAEWLLKQVTPTHNVVVFHHNDVEITHRNGVPTHPIYNRDQNLPPEAEEHEFRQSQDAEDAQQRSGGDQEPEPAGAHPGDVQEGGGQVADTAGDARRGGAEEGEGGRQAPDLTTAHGGPWSEIGKNQQGEPVYENGNGIRATMDNGVPWTEATKEHPENGRVPHDEGNRPERVRVVEAPSAAEKPTEEIGQNQQTAASSSVETAPEEITPSATPEPAPTKIRTPRQKREPDPYTTVPKEPKRLIQFLREPAVINKGTIHEQTIPGGIRDVGGDVKAALGGAKGRPGLINNAAGRHLDDATLRAWEAGYFPEHDQRPEINHLLDAIREDHEGAPRYAIHDQEAVDAHHGALDQNSEIDRLAAQHDIPTRGVTRDQFFDRLADRLEQRSLEEAAAHHAEMDASLGADVDEFGHELKNWNGDEVYGNDPPRTLEDLENEHRQEDASGASGEGDPGHEGRGRAASPETAGEAGARQDGRDSRPSGRDGATGGAGEGGRRDVDLLGAPRRAPSAPRAPEFTIHNDPTQAVMPGMESSARQAQAARDAAPPRSGQKAADEGLFARPEAVQPELVPAAPVAWIPATAGNVAKGHRARITAGAWRGEQGWITGVHDTPDGPMVVVLTDNDGHIDLRLRSIEIDPDTWLAGSDAATKGDGGNKRQAAVPKYPGKLVRDR